MRMRRELLILLVVIVTLTGGFVLFRNLILRDNNPEEPDDTSAEETCQHEEIDRRKTKEQDADGYERADCDTPGFHKELYYCSCGFSMGEALVYENALGHNMNGNECDRCGHLVESEGLQYVCVGASYYSVVGMGRCKDKKLVIPAVYEGLPVKTISNNAFVGEDIVLVVIPDSITTIGRGAFANCLSLANVSLGSSVISVEYDAFAGCNDLEYTTYGGANYLGNEANPYIVLMDCADPKAVECEINRDTKVIAAGAFEGCGRLREITIPSRVKTIGEKAFYDCTNLLSVTLGSGVIDIDSNAFLYCHKLVEVYDLSPIVSVVAGKSDSGYIGYYALDVYTSKDAQSNLSEDADRFAFYDNGSVRYLMAYHGDQVEISLPSAGNAYEMYSHALSRLDIESVDALAGPTSIGTYAFKRCEKLSVVLLPDGMTEIASGAFDGCKALSILSIPDDVTSVGSYAFKDCKALTSIALPAGVTAINDHSFMGCSSLQYVTVNGVITSVGAHAFDGCDQLTEFDLSNATTIGDYAFNECYAITDIALDSAITVGDCAFSGVSVSALVIPTRVTSVGARAFDGCQMLTQLTVDSGRSTNLTFGEFAFANCPALKKVTLPGKVSAISDGMFSDCAALADITIAKGIGSIGDEAFYGCDSLTKVVLPSSVTAIGNLAFSGCSRLGSIAFGSALKTIGNHAFESCYNLMSVSLPSSVTSVGDGAFHNCFKLVEVDVDEITDGLNVDNSYLTAYALNVRCDLGDTTRLVVQNDFVFYSHDDGYYLVGYIGNDESITLPASIGGKSYEIYSYAFYRYDNLEAVDLSGASVIGIGDNSFNKCHNLASVKLPDSVTAIGAYAFNECENLSEVILGDNSVLASIGSHAFYDCESLTVINLGDKLASVGAYAFYGCDLADLELGSSITVIDEYAFANNSHLVSVSMAGAIGHIGDYAFYGCNDLAYLTISAANNAFIGVSAFESTDITAITLPEGVVSIRENAFKNCGFVDTITLPASLEEIGEGAFYATSPSTITMADGSKTYKADVNCLIEISTSTLLLGSNRSAIPEYVRIIAPNAFRSCYGITELDLSGIVKIGDGAFEDCFAIVNVTFGDNLVSLGHSAFKGCAGLTSVVLPASLSEIGDYAFHTCSSLNNLVIGAGVQVIGDAAFQYTGITALVLPESVREIGTKAFAECLRLNSVVIPEGVTVIESGAFESCTALTDVVIGQGTEVIASKAFYGCEALTAITLPSTLTDIEANAFAGCNEVKKIIVDGTRAQFDDVNIDSTNKIFSDKNVKTIYTK